MGKPHGGFAFPALQFGAPPSTLIGAGATKESTAEPVTG